MYLSNRHVLKLDVPFVATAAAGGLATSLDHADLTNINVLADGTRHNVEEGAHVVKQITSPEYIGELVDKYISVKYHTIEADDHHTYVRVPLSTLGINHSGDIVDIRAAGIRPPAGHHFGYFTMHTERQYISFTVINEHLIIKTRNVVDVTVPLSGSELHIHIVYKGS